MNQNLSQYHEVVVEPAKNGNGFSVYGYGTYGPTSVLAGQTKKVYLDGGYKTADDALSDYPIAEIGGGYTPCNDMGSTPADWFNPADAGEHWDSDY